MEGATMTSGVDMTVMDTPTVDTTMMDANIDVATETTPVSTLEGFETSSLSSSAERTAVEPVDLETSFANQLLETAKMKDPKASWEQLERRDFEEMRIINEILPEDEGQSFEEITEATMPLEPDLVEGEPVIKPVGVQIEEIRKEVDEIKANSANKEMLKMQLEAFEALERILLLMKLLKEEEKNKGVDWGKLMGAFADLMIFIFVPESEKKKSNEIAPEQTEELPDNVFELLKYYRERKKVVQFPTAPRIENQAA